MPVKDEALYLEECLQSIINQTEPNWELWICDDHSTDDTALILQKYDALDSRIHWISNEGDGIIPSLQTAYLQSSGNFITRMDGDDIMPKKKLETLKSILLNNGEKHIATGKVKYFPVEQIADGFYTYEKWLNKLCVNQNHWSEVYKECVIPSPCWMMYRKDFEACGGFNPMTYPEDYDLVFRMYKQGFKVIGSQDILHLWRDHAERTSRNSEHYQTQTFFKLKLHYLFQVENLLDKKIVIWGAGKKGKVLATHLKDMGHKHHWICDNYNKIGKDIYGTTLGHFTELDSINNPCVLVTVSGHEDRSEIIQTLTEVYHLEENKEFFLFC